MLLPHLFPVTQKSFGKKKPVNMNTTLSLPGRTLAVSPDSRKRDVSTLPPRMVALLAWSLSSPPPALGTPRFLQGQNPSKQWSTFLQWYEKTEHVWTLFFWWNKIVNHSKHHDKSIDTNSWKVGVTKIILHYHPLANVPGRSLQTRCLLDAWVNRQKGASPWWQRNTEHSQRKRCPLHTSENIATFGSSLVSR